MLGFGGHFSTKSRAYSTTLGTLRADRAAHQRETAHAAGLLPDLNADTTLTITDWHFIRREPSPIGPYPTATLNGSGRSGPPDLTPGGDGLWT